MMIHKKRKGFTIIELIVVIAIIGILVLLASMMFKGHVEKARTARISNDIKATETVMTSKIIDDENFIDDWESINDTKLQELADAEQGGLYDKEGKIVDTVIPGNYKKIEKEEIKDQLKLGLPGDFYINEKGGEVYYYEENVNGTPTPDETVEVDPPLTETEIADLIADGVIPVANAKELNQIRPAGKDENGDYIYKELTWGKGTKWERDCTGTMDSNYIQVAHIDMSDYGGGEGWQPIGDVTAFTGEYNGANYYISNLFINRPEDYQGLFGSATDATLSNIVLQDVNVTGTRYTGRLVGRARSSIITNSYATGATGSVSGTNDVGGLVGRSNEATIMDSYATGSVSGSYRVGGLVGSAYDSTEITNSYATGEVNGTGNDVGGLVGSASSSSITNSYATGSVKGTNQVGGLVGNAWEASVRNNSNATGSVSGTDYVGGLVGRADSSSEITDSHATGSVNGESSTGGLVGYTYRSVKITDSYATGSVTGTGDYVGGLVGYALNSGTQGTHITDSYTTGSVTGTRYTGGLVGTASRTTITNSYTTGEVIGTGSSVGGLVGDARVSTEITNSYATGSVTGMGWQTGGLVGNVYTSTITNSYATGKVSGTSHNVGGLAGWADSSTITNSYATGEVIGTGERTGGLVGGAWDAIVRNSYATGSVSGTDYVGGLVGYADSVGLAGSSNEITNSYTTGEVSGKSYVGGLMGAAYYSNVTGSYYDIDTTGKYTGRGTGKNTVDMKLKETFIDWNFDDIWVIDEGQSYPYLKYNPQSPVPGM